ncbi:MAG: hypothetical protein Q8L14_11555 [Myxococcales bacterium]|nr:hypothetical protein [Myxococcales bacterium]
MHGASLRWGPRRWPPSWACAGALVVLLLSASCGLVSTRSATTCPKDTVPCGDGCIPPKGVCCDDGTGKTSSYCTNQATGCMVNDRGCQAVFPAGVTGAFCCGSTGSIGSNDCPEGERHCGLLCQPKDRPCCAEGSTAEDCPTATYDDQACTRVQSSGWVRCGMCRSPVQCVSCPPGRCCSGDPCSDLSCVVGTACTGVPTGAGGGSAGSCSKVTAAGCCASASGTRTTACAIAPPCTCPTGTTFVRVQTDGNTLCACP